MLESIVLHGPFHTPLLNGVPYPLWKTLYAYINETMVPNGTRVTSDVIRSKFKTLALVFGAISPSSEAMLAQDYVDIPILQGTVVRKKVNRGKNVYIDVNFQNTNETSNVDAIIFQNYYCSSLSIAQQNSLQEYVTIVDNFVLMDDAHSEEKSQSWFTLPSSLFRSTYVPGRSMRFTLYQPDTTWQRFEIHNIRFVTATERSTTPTKNINLNNFNLLQVIESDWCLLNEATQAQKNIVEMPPITFTMAEYKKSIKKKEKKKDKKGSIAQPANDDFGIAIPTFPKNSELPDNV